MEFISSPVNPLQELLDIIPEEGMWLDVNSLEKIAMLFLKGGLKCETYGELMDVIHKFCEWYTLTELTSVNGQILFKKV